MISASCSARLSSSLPTYLRRPPFNLDRQLMQPSRVLDTVDVPVLERRAFRLAAQHRERLPLALERARQSRGCLTDGSRNLLTSVAAFESGMRDINVELAGQATRAAVDR